MIVKKPFYQKNTLAVAKNLLGCFLVRKIGKKTIRGMITETEAYVGEDDLACHASRGRTKRTETMYGEAGRAYIYMIYGIYHCLNVVTEKKGFPAAVLIRSVKIFERPMSGRKTSDAIELDGPGKLCGFMKIDRELNGLNISLGKRLWIEKGIKTSAKNIRNSKRIGIDYARHCRHYLWRFYIQF